MRIFRTTTALRCCVRELPDTLKDLTGKGGFFCDRALAATDFAALDARGLASTLAAARATLADVVLLALVCESALPAALLAFLPGFSSRKTAEAFLAIAGLVFKLGMDHLIR